MKKTILAALLACVLAAAPAPAPAQQREEPSPARMSAAREMMAASKVRETFDATLARMLSAQIEANPEMQQYEQVMRDFFGKYMKWDDMEPEFARVYAETYTEQELRDLTTFYRTPLGQRLVATTPEVAVRGAGISERRVQRHMPELFAAIMERVAQQQQQAAPGGSTAP
ncbi:MAG TPA: DUF2059 domain-containing protein [Longimicrobium sp.]|nr:DUF2059 domain-containing protein [Longimicrobium sp.]